MLYVKEDDFHPKLSQTVKNRYYLTNQVQHLTLHLVGFHRFSGKGLSQEPATGWEGVV